MATRAAVDRCGFGYVTTPLSPTGTEGGQGRGGEFGVELCGEDPGHPPPQAGIVYCPMDMDDVPPASGSRPDRQFDVSGPQERVQRHTVDQIVLVVSALPTFEIPVPQMVEQLVDVLRFVDALVFVAKQVIEVPKIIFETSFRDA